MFPDYTDNEKRILDSVIRPVSMKPRVAARFKLRAMKGDFIVRESAWSKNLIVNGWLDRMFQNPNSSTVIAGFLAGSGTSAPAVTDTALQSYLGGGNSFQEAWATVNSTASPRSKTHGIRIRGDEGAVVGNVSEIALYYGDSGALSPNSTRSIINRARVTDEFGSPTSITVLSDEFLEVAWEFTIYAIEGATGTLTINIDGTPTNFDYEIQPVSMNSTTWWGANLSATTDYSTFVLSGVPSARTGSSSGASSVTGESTFSDPSASGSPDGYSTGNNFTSRVLGTYTPGTPSRLTTIRLPLNNGNLSAPGIRSINITLSGGSANAQWFAHQVLLDGPFVKPPTHVFDLPINVAMGNA